MNYIAQCQSYTHFYISIATTIIICLKGVLSRTAVINMHFKTQRSHRKPSVSLKVKGKMFNHWSEPKSIENNIFIQLTSVPDMSFLPRLWRWTRQRPPDLMKAMAYLVWGSGYVHLTGPKGAQIFGHTSFKMCLWDCLGWVLGQVSWGQPVKTLGEILGHGTVWAGDERPLMRQTGVFTKGPMRRMNGDEENAQMLWGKRPGRWSGERVQG